MVRFGSRESECVLGCLDGFGGGGGGSLVEGTRMGSEKGSEEERERWWLCEREE